MANDENKEVILRWFEAVNFGDIPLLDKLADELFTPDFIAHDLEMVDSENGPVFVKKFIHQVLKENTNFHITVHDIFAYEDKTASRVTLSMTEAASGKTVNMELLAITRFVDGQIAEAWPIGDPGKLELFPGLHYSGHKPNL